MIDPKKLEAGRQYKTASGGMTTPFPHVDFDTDEKAGNTLSRVQSWLLANAVSEAERRQDSHSAAIFQQKQPGSMPSSDIKSVEIYLWDEDDFAEKASMKTPPVTTMA